MPTSINGLPAHILLVHAVVVVVPLAALLLIASAWWPAARRKLGLFTPLVALLAVVLVPVTTHAGEWLRAHVPVTPLINRHAEMGDALLPWVLAMFVLAALVWYVHAGHRLPGRVGSAARRIRASRDDMSPAGAMPATAADTRVSAGTLVVAALATILAVGSVVQTLRIGESGSKAVRPHAVPGSH